MHQSAPLLTALAAQKTRWTAPAIPRQDHSVPVCRSVGTGSETSYESWDRTRDPAALASVELQEIH